MSEPSSLLHTRPSLLMRLRDAGDAAAWKMFVDIYGPFIYRHARRKGLQDADAADFTQDVLGQVVRGMGSFEYSPNRGRFRDWLRTVARRCLGRFIAKLGTTVVNPLPAEGVEASLADSEWTAEFNAYIFKLALERVRPHFEPTSWRVFERVWFDHRSAIETAEELGVSIESVYVTKSRVIKRLEEEVLLLAEDAIPIGT